MRPRTELEANARAKFIDEVSQLHASAPQPGGGSH